MSKIILIVDDEPDLLKTTSFRLAKAGYDVLVASDGEEGYNKAVKHKPGLILLDMQLPKISGGEVCKKLKQDPETRNIPVIFLTASHPTEVIEEMRKFCANDFIIKPFDSENLIEKVKKYVL